MASFLLFSCDAFVCCIALIGVLVRLSRGKSQHLLNDMLLRSTAFTNNQLVSPSRSLHVVLKFILLHSLGCYQLS